MSRIFYTPVQIATDILRVASGDNHILFVKTDGTLWTMGNNKHGQLGDGTTTYHRTPVQVANHVLQAAAGEYHSLFVKSDGSLWAMGDNYYGQLGDGTTTDARLRLGDPLHAKPAIMIYGGTPANPAPR